MERSALVILSFNFIYIALLPVIFFRKSKKLTYGWFFTALPFALSPLGVIASYYGYLPPWADFGDVASIMLSAISIALISYTLGTHKIPIALWHQKDDAPLNIVTYGAYQYIRHPFYASFILAFIAAFVYAPQIITFAALAYAMVCLNLTAGKEEERLCRSDFGLEYKAYMEQSGRFWPLAIKQVKNR
ncbi:MAG: isoprenylcysteine carboxylmethyltransferase family protein [Candidatus Obscuribacterales bacterium]|nr:isoprenylcysteine carboxylmethyltransferase family protein [Candidatus Obscuribacterales bacterium]